MGIARNLSATGLIPLFCAWVVLGLALLPDVAAQERVWWEDAIGMEMVSNTLDGFKFEGLPIGCSLEDFTKKYPQAKLDSSDELDRKAGVTCYTVEKLKSADRAQFFFLDGQLYQMEIEYGTKRID